MLITRTPSVSPSHSSVDSLNESPFREKTAAAAKDRDALEVARQAHRQLNSLLSGKNSLAKASSSRFSVPAARPQVGIWAQAREGILESLAEPLRMEPQRPSF